jgi:non-lysosomal glucosylceramidase
MLMDPRFGRRHFLGAAVAAPVAAQTQGAGVAGAPAKPEAAPAAAPAAPALAYPRVFSGRQLAMLAFPLGGVGAGSLSLGGRGQLRDWEIFNRADKGLAPEYGFASIWARAGKGKPFASVLEARIAPPYEGSSGLGSRNAPGLRRLESAVFTGEYPVARIGFRDPRLPVKVSLEAFTPFIPLAADESGLPVAVLRYKVSNPGTAPASVSIAFALSNVVGLPNGGPGRGRVNDRRESSGLSGFLMRDPTLKTDDPAAGTFALAVLEPGTGRVSARKAWPKGKWWASPMLYWDDFTADGSLDESDDAGNPVASVCLGREIAPGAEAAFTFLLAWHFPNRTPEWCGWSAPKRDERTVIGNHYATRFGDAWEAAEYAARSLPALEPRMRRFVEAVRETTLPPAVKDAAMANLSTLATNTCFRTSDGEFHGFEGTGDKRGCCMGSCTHVWNYESATHNLFPSLARSMRRAAFEASSAEGAVPNRILLPEGKQHDGMPAADGQMGQIIKTYFDWQLSGDDAWLRRMWPTVKRAIEFCWAKGGWDGDRDGVMEGVQHNTYDVEFYGPNPMCGIYYLGGLRAAEEMARAVGDEASAREYHALYDRGRGWIDANLFNGEYYIQKTRGIPVSQIHPVLHTTGGAEDTEHPDFQLGEGCLVDQLVGQYVATFAGLGWLLDEKKIRKTLESIYRYNYKRGLWDHESVQRIFALNDESALVICDYGRAKRPRVPFPYYAEVMTGFEYSAAVLMLYAGMEREGIECIGNIRRRYDGERRNPWNEAECGHHYARAMAAWTGLVALSGFRYRGAERAVEAMPRSRAQRFRSFWSAGTAWGSFELARQESGLRFSIAATEGEMAVRRVELAPRAGGGSTATVGGKALVHKLERGRAAVVVTFDEVRLAPGRNLVVTL